MNEEILQILYEQGPRTVQQLEDIMLCDLYAICEHLAFLILAKQLYLELDGTIWFAGEVTG